MDVRRIPGKRPLFCAVALFVIAGWIVIALPHRLEGPVLVRISAGHGVSVSDLVALGPLLTGLALLVLWWPRRTLLMVVTHRHGFAVATAFLAGVGLGLVTASVFRRFFGWWVVGVALLTLAIALTSIPSRDGSHA